MAAHALTGIEQILEDPAGSLPHMQSALALDCWTADLTMNHYDLLSRAVTLNSEYSLLQWALDHRQHYMDEWLDLGMPETREQWREAKYGG